MLSTSTSGLKLASTIHTNGISVHALSTINRPCANTDRKTRLIEIRVFRRGALTSVSVPKRSSSEALRILPLLSRPAPVHQREREDHREQHPRDRRRVAHPKFHERLEVNVIRERRGRSRRAPAFGEHARLLESG